MATERATAMKNEFQEEAESIQSRLRGQLDQTRQKIREGIADARDRLSGAKMQAGDIFDDAMNYVRDNPGKMLIAALGVGIGVGLLLRSRASDWVEEEEVDVEE